MTVNNPFNTAFGCLSGGSVRPKFQQEISSRDRSAEQGARHRISPPRRRGIRRGGDAPFSFLSRLFAAPLGEATGSPPSRGGGSGHGNRHRRGRLHNGGAGLQ